MNGSLETSSGSSKGGEQNIEVSPCISKGGQNMVYGYVTAHPKSYVSIKNARDEMKHHPTQAEELLWKYLRNKRTGHKIRRQHIIGKFVADFVCLPKKLIIEVDGKIHEKQKEQDEHRTEILNQLDYQVIRFSNEEVLNSPEGVFKKIKVELDRI